MKHLKGFDTKIRLDLMGKMAQKSISNSLIKKMFGFEVTMDLKMPKIWFLMVIVTIINPPIFIPCQKIKK